MRKPFWKSRTVWFNVLTAAATIAGAPAALGLNPTVAGLILTGANIGLRCLTHAPIGVTPASSASGAGAGDPAGV